MLPLYFLFNFEESMTCFKMSLPWIHLHRLGHHVNLYFFFFGGTLIAVLNKTTWLNTNISYISICQHFFLFSWKFVGCYIWFEGLSWIIKFWRIYELEYQQTITCTAEPWGRKFERSTYFQNLLKTMQKLEPFTPLKK